MFNEKISVIIPTYNTKDYIEETIKSICAQTYKNIEILIIDDGSTDGTQKKIKNLAKSDDRIKFIFKENEGVTKTRLRGVKEASGDWIGFVDSDDKIEPRMYEILMEKALSYQVDISHCGYQKVFSDRVDYYYGTEKLIVQDNAQGLIDLLKGIFIEPGLWNKLYKRILFEPLLKDLLIDDSIKINEDLLMNFYLFREAKKSIFYDKCLYRYISREGSASTSKLNVHKLCDPLKVRKIIYQETVNDKELNLLATESVLTKLINLATIKIKKNSKWISSYRADARKELKKFYKVTSKKKLPKKIKIMAKTAIYCPIIYRFLHDVLRKKHF
ncbi:MAG: glycosyltransferase family 2 protein [Clostridia bacterium]|nr:glycosyltransferase family 2 protein [Clostridia bacterium]